MLSKICKIVSVQDLQQITSKISQNIVLKHYPPDLPNIISPNISPRNLSQLNLIRREDENLKVSTQRNSTSSVFHQTPRPGCNSHLRPIFPEFSHFCEKKVWETSGFGPASSAISFHLSLEAKTFQNFQCNKRSNATNAQIGTDEKTQLFSLLTSIWEVRDF